MDCRTHPTHDSIFGDTYHGVPNPLVPHRASYPTRFHGPVNTWLEARLPYVERPYAVAPYAGLGQERSAASYLPPLLIGGVFGYIVAPAERERKVWAAVGAATTALAGVWGVLGTGALAFLWADDRRARQGG